MIHKFPPDPAFLTERVAIANDIDPIMHKIIGPRSEILCIRVVIITRTPVNPRINPKVALKFNWFLKILHPKNATIKGIVLAIIAAIEASTSCIAIKFNPKYMEFWQIPKMNVAFH